MTAVEMPTAPTTPAPDPAPGPAPDVEPAEPMRRPHWVHVGPRLKSLRERANLSQKRFADLSREVDPKGKGISSYSVIRHEAGVHAPRPATVSLLAATLSRALGEKITDKDLRMAGKTGLADYLETVRTSQYRTKADFYGALGIGPARAAGLLSGEMEWTNEELRAVHRHYTEALDLIMSVVLDLS